MLQICRSSLIFQLRTILIILAFLCVPLLSCAQDHSASREEGSSHKAAADEKNRLHWGYRGIEGPRHWGLLTKKYATCETGSKQSPIDIQTKDLPLHQESLIFNYRTSELHEMNNGHTVQVSHKSGCHVALNNRTFDLRQFHFHEPSEHHVDGKAFPMEMHFVHQDEAGKILVIAVMMEVGPEHPALKNIWKWLPDQIGKESSFPINSNLREILPENTRHFTYSGSLTTPPCSEGVQWLVLTEPIKVSENSLRKFLKIIGPNARPVQPLGDRQIEIK
jgi:carbonic anhydrase